MNETAKKALKIILKIAVSIAAIAFVVSKIDLESTKETLLSAKISYLLLALVVYTVSQMLSAMRINSLFVTIPLKLDTFMNMRLYWLGMFYNFFLPGGVGGDGYKIYYLKKHYKQSAKELFTYLFSDRLSGLVIICCYLVLFVSFFVVNLPIPYKEWAILLLPLGLAAYYLFLWIFKRTALKAYWKVVGYSFVIQGLQMCAACLILYSLGETNNFDSYMFLFFMSSIASAIPIGLPGGIGLREMTFVIGSQYLGTQEGVAVSLSVLFYTVSLFSSLPGAIFAMKTSLIEGKGNGEETDIAS